MIAILLFLTASLYAGENWPTEGKLISYNDKTILLQTKFGKVRLLKEDQTTQDLIDLDKNIGKVVTLQSKPKNKKQK